MSTEPIDPAKIRNYAMKHRISRQQAEHEIRTKDRMTAGTCGRPTHARKRRK